MTSAITREGELDREINGLIAKIVRGEATTEDRGRYDQLVYQRMKMMQVERRR